MNAKNKIKIVKRAEPGNESPVDASNSGHAESQPNAARTVAQHVTSWVKEFQQRRIQERGRSFESLFQRA
ncbi:MAG TPA: hypothetical protein VGC66_08465 [Pyrinomonadaceae bacterium]|jgi:hypothetical protein